MRTLDTFVADKADEFLADLVRDIQVVFEMPEADARRVGIVLVDARLNPQSVPALGDVTEYGQVESAMRGEIDRCSFEMDDRSLGMMTRALAGVRRDAFIEALRMVRYSVTYPTATTTPECRTCRDTGMVQTRRWEDWDVADCPDCTTPENVPTPGSGST